MAAEHGANERVVRQEGIGLANVSAQQVHQTSALLIDWLHDDLPIRPRSPLPRLGPWVSEKGERFA